MTANDVPSDMRSSSITTSPTASAATEGPDNVRTASVNLHRRLILNCV